MQTEPYRWRLTPSLIAHLWKATTQQHHRALRPLLARCVPHDGVVFDVGAHAGQFTKLFARLAPAGQVYAIEPGSYARSILRAAVWTQRLHNVAIVPMALGAEERLVRLHMPIKPSGAVGFGLSHLGAPEARWPRIAVETVAQTTIDELSKTLALKRLDFIKADIEGSEMRMLEGARRSLEEFRPRLLLELSDTHLARCGDTIGETFAFLRTQGYWAFAMQPHGGLTPVSEPREGDFWWFPAEDPLATTQ